MNGVEQAQNIWSLLILAVLVLLGLWVTGRIVQKAGINRWWSVLILVPGINLGAIWWFSLARWPSLEGRSSGD